MTNVAIITDTDSSLPKTIAKQYGIQQVPINIHFGEDTLAACDEIDDEATFRRVDRDGKLPTTSAPSPGRFAQAYQAAFDAGADEVVCFTVSSKVSAVYVSAMNACELVPGRKIRVVDTESLSMGQGFIALAGAKAAQAGVSADEVVAHAMSVGKRVRLFAALATLKYLAMSGRVGHLTAGIANLLDVRPILSIKDGKLDLLERTRTQGKSWARLIELAQQNSLKKNLEHLAIIHVNAPEMAHKFQNQLCSVLPCPKEIITAELTPGLSVHTGTGVVGFVFVTEN